MSTIYFSGVYDPIEDSHAIKHQADMFGSKKGSWSVESKKDSRWNKSGEGYGLVCSGGPSEMKEWIEECIKKYGDPPDDATQTFMKY